MYLLRGFEFTHEAVRDWEERFAPLLAEHIRGKRKRKVGRRWYVDETYLKVNSLWWNPSKIGSGSFDATNDRLRRLGGGKLQ
jgi:hypothetical protein